MTPFHKPHKKPAIAAKVNKGKVRRWLIKLDKIFIEIEMREKNK